MNIVIIPTILKENRAIKLAQNYEKDELCDEVWIYDNGHKNFQALIDASNNSKKIKYFNTIGMSIYQQWNHGLYYAIEKHPSNILISNDDISICDNLVSSLSNSLELNEKYWISYPCLDRPNGIGVVETMGTFADYGMLGFCWMISSNAFKHGVPLIDENFIWWGGDDDIAQSVHKHGGIQIRVNESWITHEHSSTASSPNFGWTNDAVSQDIVYLRKKWNISR
jgi:GT2 family glycosyltransferase